MGKKHEETFLQRWFRDGTWKHVQHHYPLEKCKLKIEYYLISIRKVKKTKTMTIPNAGEDSEKLGH